MHTNDRSLISETWVQAALLNRYKNLQFQREVYCPKTNHVIDFVWQSAELKIAIEVDGVIHIIPETKKPTVKTQFRDFQLRQAAWRVITIPIWQTNYRNKDVDIATCLQNELDSLVRGQELTLYKPGPF